MSMPKIEKTANPIDREQSVNDLIESVALMETGLSHIINAEGEKIQKAIKYDDPTADVPLDDIIKVNDSAQKMINTVSKLEMILQSKLETSKDLDEAIGTPGPTGPEGPPGRNGLAATIEVGSVSALPFSDTYVRNVGTPTNAILEFGIPAGPQGVKGDKGDTGPQGPAVITEFATYFRNSSVSYKSGDIMSFNMTLTESGISMDSTRTKIKLGSKSYYKISFGVNVLRIDSGSPRLEILVNGNAFRVPTSLNMYSVGYNALELIYPLAPNDEISFIILDGALTLYPNYSGLTEYLTIMSIK